MRVLGPALLLLALPAYAQVYKCVDQRGVTHYSDKPRLECRSAEVDIQPIPPVSGQVMPRNENLGAQEREFQRRQIERGRVEQAEARAREEQKRRCASLRSEVQRYGTQRRIAVTDAKGERTFMDDAARDAKLAQLNAEIAQKCP